MKKIKQQIAYIYRFKNLVYKEVTVFPVTSLFCVVVQETGICDLLGYFSGVKLPQLLLIHQNLCRELFDGKKEVSTLLVFEVERGVSK